MSKKTEIKALQQRVKELEQENALLRQMTMARDTERRKVTVAQSNAQLELMRRMLVQCPP